MLEASGGLRSQQVIRSRILERNPICDRFFAHEARPLATACAQMARCFLRGGRLLCFGRGAYATDAMHLSVEFIHPVIVGKRALPALDVSMAAPHWVSALCTAHDMAIALGPPAGDREFEAVLQAARPCGAMTIAFPGSSADYAVAAPTADEHIHQELFELLGHTMYESVQVFLEHDVSTGDKAGAGAATFLYPFLNAGARNDTLIDDVAASIVQKAADANQLRAQIADRQAAAIEIAASAIRERLEQGGTMLAFGNGGSATDATDFALDCVMPSVDCAPLRAISIALEPAVLTATANDVGSDLMFARQIIAQAKPYDVAVAFSTSGGSRNVIAALEEARKRKLLTIALLGYDGGDIVRRNLADIAIVVECDYIPRIQEAQATVYHVLREQIARC